MLHKLLQFASSQDSWLKSVVCLKLPQAQMPVCLWTEFVRNSNSDENNDELFFCGWNKKFTIKWNLPQRWASLNAEDRLALFRVITANSKVWISKITIEDNQPIRITLLGHSKGLEAKSGCILNFGRAPLSSARVRCTRRTREAQYVSPSLFDFENFIRFYLCRSVFPSEARLLFPAAFPALFRRSAVHWLAVDTEPAFVPCKLINRFLCWLISGSFFYPLNGVNRFQSRQTNKWSAIEKISVCNIFCPNTGDFLVGTF